MKVVFLSVVIVLSLLWTAWSDDCVEGEEDCSTAHAGGRADTQNNILILTDENFGKVVKEEEMVLVTFYAPWCHHCHNAIAVFEEAAASLMAHGIAMGKLDIQANKETKQRYQIKQVPEARIFKKGVMYPYEGPADLEGVDAVVDFMVKERQKDEGGAVLRFTEENFDNILRVSPLVLVEFFAEWCAPCQALEPHFHAAARRLTKEKAPIILGQVQVPDQLELAKRYSLTNYPVLLVFRYGKQYEYSGPRDSDEGIVKYMLRQAGPGSVPLESVSDVEEFASDDDEVRVVGFLDGPKEVDRFIEAGNGVRMLMSLGHCANADVARSMGFEMNSVVVFHSRNLVSKYEVGHVVISSLPEDIKEMEEVLLEHATPLIGEMNNDNQILLFNERPLLVAYYDVSWDKELKKATSYWHNLIASVAKDFVGKDISFAIANEEDFPTDIKLLGLEDWGEDISVGIFAPNNIRYPMKEEIYPDTLREFITNFLQGDLEPYLRSESVPRKSKKSGGIQTVVGSTFSKFMNIAGKNSMVKLCMDEAPKCEDAKGHYHQVVIRYEGSNEIVFGEMNMALNDLPVKVDGIEELPVYLFSPKDSTELIQVSPAPTDENDIVFFLKYRHSLRPTVSDRELDRRAEKKKKEQDKKRKEREAEKKKNKEKEEL